MASANPSRSFMVATAATLAPRGGVPERSNGAVLKTVEPYGSVSSNLTPAALCVIARELLAAAVIEVGVLRGVLHLLARPPDGDRLGVGVDRGDHAAVDGVLLVAAE